MVSVVEGVEEADRGTREGFRFLHDSISSLSSGVKRQNIAHIANSE